MRAASAPRLRVGAPAARAARSFRCGAALPQAPARRAASSCARVVHTLASLKPSAVVFATGGATATLATAQAGYAAELDTQGVLTVITEAGFSSLDVGLAALALTFAVVAAIAGADKRRLAAADSELADLRAKLGAAEAAARAEREAAVASALKREGERIRSEALAAAKASLVTADGPLSASQAEEIRVAVAAARDELAARERSIQEKSEAIEAKTNAIAERLLQERDAVSARVAAAEKERAAAARELALVLQALGEARSRAAAAEAELAKRA